MHDSWKEPEKSKGKGKGSATQRTVKGNGRATQLAVKGTSCATGCETKTGKDATLPPLLGPNQDLVRKGKHSRFAWHLQRVAGSTVLAELILLTGCVDRLLAASFLRWFLLESHARGARQLAALQHLQVDACTVWAVTWPGLINIYSFSLAAALLLSTLRRLLCILLLLHLESFLFAGIDCCIP